MPEFLTHHGYQSQARGYVTENDTLRDQWIALNYPVIPENVIDNKSDFGMDGVDYNESIWWRSYYSNNYKYWRQAELNEVDYLNSPGVRSVNFTSQNGWTIEEVCKLYYKFTGVRNNVATPVTASFPNNTFPERNRQLQTANIASNGYDGVGNAGVFSLDSTYHYGGASYGDVMFFGKHSGWAWNSGASDETRQWIPNFSVQYDNYANDPHNNYLWRTFYNPIESEYFARDQYWLGRATYVGYVPDYAYQSDITNGNGVVVTNWRDTTYSVDVQRSDDHSQDTFMYTHDISLRPFGNSDTDAFFWEAHDPMSVTMVGGDTPFRYWTQYSLPGDGFDFPDSQESEYMARRFNAMQFNYSASQGDNEYRIINSSYIKIPVTYWTTTVNGITIYNRRTGTAGIENVINIEPVFAS